MITSRSLELPKEKEDRVFFSIYVCGTSGSVEGDAHEARAAICIKVIWHSCNCTNLPNVNKYRLEKQGSSCSSQLTT